MELLETLEGLLKKESNYVNDNGDLKKWVVLSKAQKGDADLFQLLLGNKEIKSKFFFEVNGVLIFNQLLFSHFLEQKSYINDSYTQYKKKIDLNIGSRYFKQVNETVLVWPFKDAILEGGQNNEENKREEIFFNEILAQDEITQLFEPKVLTNAVCYTSVGTIPFKKFNRKHDGTISDNLIIKGNNLLALHSIKREFEGKIKVIYIDPPYNTGSDGFGYNDNFNHSTWMTFMKNRIEIARKFLTPDGSLFIQINDIEEAYLKVLCDEIFTRENFHTSICVQMSHLSGVKMAHKDKKLPKIKEYILFYTNSKKIKLIPQYIPATWEDALDRYTSYLEKNNYTDDQCKKWKIVPLRQAMKAADVDVKDEKAVNIWKLNNADLIFRTAMNRGANYDSYNPEHFTKIINPDGSYYFIYKGEDVSFAAEKVAKINGKLTPVVAIGDIWTDIGINNLSNEGGVDLRFGKKPEKIIERLIKMVSSSEDDIIMDFFCGSGTSGAVAHKLNRQYIIIEQLDNHMNKTVQRINNVIKENKLEKNRMTIFFELKKYNQDFINKIEIAKDTKALLQIWDEMKSKSFIKYNVDIKEYDFHIAEIKKDTLANQKKTLLKHLDLNQIYVNLSSLMDSDFKCSEDEKRVTMDFYKLNTEKSVKAEALKSINSMKATKQNKSKSKK